MTDFITPIAADQPTFAGFDRCDDLATLDADIAIIGAEFGWPYAGPGPQQGGPRVIRAGSQRFGRFINHYDVDLGGTILNDSGLRVVDCGDVVVDPDTGAENHARIEAAIRQIRARGAMPIVLGGDDSVPIPVVRALDDLTDAELMHFDAHIDFRDERDGISDGLSSGIKRASEKPYIRHITQMGLRGLGSAFPPDAEAAIANGNTFHPAREIRQNGAESVIAQYPAMETAIISFDVDVLDPAIAPGVNSYAPGGLTYWLASDLLTAIPPRAAIAAAIFTEVDVRKDREDATGAITARLILNLIAALARSSQFA